MNSKEKQNLNSRVQKVFIAENLTKLDVDIFGKINLSSEAKIILCEIGVPDWCAPHLHFDFKDGFLKHNTETSNLHIGSDGQERFLCINRETEIISALNVDGHRLIIADNLLEMMKLLVSTAEIIDEHLQSNPDFSFPTSSITETFTQNWIEKLQNECPDILATKSWWSDLFNTYNKTT